MVRFECEQEPLNRVVAYLQEKPVNICTRGPERPHTECSWERFNYQFQEAIQCPYDKVCGNMNWDLISIFGELIHPIVGKCQNTLIEYWNWRWIFINKKPSNTHYAPKCSAIEILQSARIMHGEILVWAGVFLPCGGILVKEANQHLHTRSGTPTHGMQLGTFQLPVPRSHTVPLFQSLW